MILEIVTSIYQYTELIRQQPGPERHTWAPLHSNKSFFLPRTGTSNLFDGACSNCELFSEKLFHVWKSTFTGTIFQIIPVAS